MPAVVECGHRLQAAILEVDRRELEFFNVKPDLVRIRFAVRNRGEVRSQPAPVLIQSAPLGAFLRWRPLAYLEVPPIDPGSQVRLQTDVVRPAENSPGVPPGRLLTAIGTGDWDDHGDRPGGRNGAEPGAVPTRETTGSNGAIVSDLALDVFDLLGRRNAHWAGNIHVLAGPRSVERHVASGLRIYAGCINMAVFVVGTRPDAYSFELTGSSLTAHAALVGVSPRWPVAQALAAGETIQKGEWLEASGPMEITLMIRVPRSCKKGVVAVHVQQRSTARVATVEFGLDASAAGAGCITI